MKTNQIFFLLLMLAVCNFAIAQKVITGKVFNIDSGEPMQGVSVVAGGSRTGVVTAADGTFSINVKPGSSSLLFSYVGFLSKSIDIEGKETIIVELKADLKENNDVVVIGYGTQKRSDVTGAVSKYKNERLEETPVARIDQALQGRIAGVSVQNTSSEAGAEAKIQVRGINSISAASSPLIVVDGQPIPDGLNFLNMADVESVEVLKDAASAAIYGSRGAGGVILVTTKQGKPSKPKYNFRYSRGAKTDYKRYDIMTTSEYTELLFAEGALIALDPSIPTPTVNQIATPAERAAYIIEQTLMDGQGTDWQRESLRTGAFQNVQLGASGGTNGMRYFISGGYVSDEGMMKKSMYERFNLRTRLDVDLGTKVKLGINLNPSYAKRQSPSENFTNFYRYPSFIPVYHNDSTAALVNTIPQWANIRPGDFAQPRHFSGIRYQGVMPDGSFWAPTGTANPFSSAQNTPRSSVLNQDRDLQEYRLQSGADLTVKLLPGLEFKSLASAYINSSNQLNWNNRNATADGVVNRGVYINNSFIDLLTENTFNYNKRVGDHSLSVLAGFTYQRTDVRTQQTTGLDYPSDNIRTLNNATTLDVGGSFGTENRIGLISYLSRVNYSFKSKYLVSATIRADGSSFFAPGNKWGYFPSISAGWMISEENFMKNVTWIDNLKIRASYGVSGNNRIQDWAFLDLMQSNNYPLGSGTGNSSIGQGTSPNIAGNGEVTWESTFQTNLGIDATFLKNRLSLTVDVYTSNTDKLLLQQSAMAFTGVPRFWNNIGSLNNKGIEIAVSSTNILTKSFKWSTAANLSAVRNKITELGQEAFLLNQGERGEVYQNKVGSQLIEFLGYKTDGVWLSQAEIDAARARGLTSSLSNVFIPGGLKLVDTNGDNIIDGRDRVIIGDPYPDFTWGITNNFSYKAFDFTFTFQGVHGGQLINGDANYNESRRMLPVFTNNRWLSPANPGDGKTPYSTSGFNWMLTDHVVENASYWALRDLNFGYTLPANVAKAIHMSSLRVYFAAQNLFFKMADNYRALNPEGRASGGPYGSTLIDGYQRGSFPIPKTLVFGIDINF